jgi:hypothetical protein
MSARRRRKVLAPPAIRDGLRIRPKGQAFIKEQAFIAAEALAHRMRIDDGARACPRSP